MSITRTATLRDADHRVTYVNNAGTTVTAPRDLILTVFAPDRPGTYPVIIYSHGHGGSGSPNGGSGTTAQALADLGYVVIVPTHLDSTATYPAWVTAQFDLGNTISGLHRAADVQFALDQAATLVAGLPGYTADLSAPVVAGHSHGAYTAALIAGLTPDRPGYDAPPGNPYGLTAVADPRFHAAILLSPQGQDSNWAGLTAASWDRISIPLLTITGTLDGEQGMGQAWEGRLDPYRNGDGDDNYAVVYRGAAHNDIGGNTANTGLTASITGLIDRFLDGHLHGDGAARALFADPGALLAGNPLLAQAFARVHAGSTGIGALTGTSGADTLSGMDGHDTIYGGAGDDTITGGFGDDIIDGGTGNDVLIVRGALADYRILIDGDNFILKGTDGTDRLTGVETIRFSDGRVFELNRMYGVNQTGGWSPLHETPDDDGTSALVLPATVDRMALLLPEGDGGSAMPHDPRDPLQGSDPWA